MNEPLLWEVKLYEAADGSSPLTEFIEQQSIRNQAKILAEFDDLVEFGLLSRGESFKHLEGRLWELRLGGESLHFRFIYCVHSSRRLLILHGFCKKTCKTPKRELEIAR
jgi:phage-related protein